MQDLPTGAYKCLTALYNVCEAKGMIPTAWRKMRQVHIPKPGKGKRKKDNATNCSALRPICVITCFWRMWGSARLSQDTTKEWIESWMPDQAFGGRPRYEVLAAVAPLMEDSATDRFIGSYDYTLAFDYTHPELVETAFTHLGMPLCTSRMLGALWQHQTRYLQYAGHTDMNPDEVESSMPQGDAWSMLAMAAVLAGPT